MDNPIVAHEDTARVQEYAFRARDGRMLMGLRARTVCGKWLTVCEDDPAYVAAAWRFGVRGDDVTCPDCLAGTDRSGDSDG